jgi:hypothetical protein
MVAEERYCNDPPLAFCKYMMCYRMVVSLIGEERYCNDPLLPICKQVTGFIIYCRSTHS